MIEEFLKKESFNGADIDFIVKNKSKFPVEFLQKLGLVEQTMVELEVSKEEVSETPVVEEKPKRKRTIKN